MGGSQRRRGGWDRHPKPRLTQGWAPRDHLLTMNRPREHPPPSSPHLPPFSALPVPTNVTSSNLQDTRRSVTEALFPTAIQLTVLLILPPEGEWVSRVSTPPHSTPSPLAGTTVPSSPEWFSCSNLVLLQSTLQSSQSPVLQTQI